MNVWKETQRHMFAHIITIKLLFTNSSLHAVKAVHHEIQGPFCHPLIDQSILYTLFSRSIPFEFCTCMSYQLEESPWEIFSNESLCKIISTLTMHHETRPSGAFNASIHRAAFCAIYLLIHVVDTCILIVLLDWCQIYIQLNRPVTEWFFFFQN